MKRPRKKIERRQPIHEKLNCHGYYGFGGGYAMAIGVTMPDRGIYCQGCPVQHTCWEAHRDRVRKIVPDLVQVFDEMVVEAGGDGRLAVKAFHDQFGSADPYTTMMGGNVEDGIYVQKSGAVKDRGEFTLPYPFEAQ
jgi:hypothetical protein